MQPPIQWVPGVPSLGIKQQGREADDSPPSTAKFKECMELYHHSSNMPSWHAAQLKHGDNFTFYLLPLPFEHNILKGKLSECL